MQYIPTESNSSEPPSGHKARKASFEVCKFVVRVLRIFCKFR